MGGRSQRAQALSYVRQRSTSVVSGEGHIGGRRAMSGGWVELIGSRRPRVRIPPSRPLNDFFRIYYQAVEVPVAAVAPGWASPDVAGRGLVTVHVGSHLSAIDPAFYSVRPGSRNSPQKCRTGCRSAMMPRRWRQRRCGIRSARMASSTSHSIRLALPAATPSLRSTPIACA